MIGVSRYINTDNKKVLALEYATIAWNIAEGLVAIISGLAIGSVALLAFGMESGIEVFSSSVVVWQLLKKKKNDQVLALRMLSVAFFVFGIYTLLMVGHSFLNATHPAASLPALLSMLAISLGMLVLGVLKKRLGTHLQNPVVLLEAKLTLLDSAVSGALFVGLSLNMLFGWWWIDLILATGIAFDALRQGFEQFREKRI